MSNNTVKDALDQNNENAERGEQLSANFEMNEKFEEIFGKETVLQCVRIVLDAVERTTKTRAFFREDNIIRYALKMAQDEIEPHILEKREFTDLITWAVEIQPFVILGKTGALTTQEMIDMENKVLLYSQDKGNEYKQPEDVVQRAIERKKGISQEQADAVYACALSEKRVTIIEGAAGAGKSYTMEAVKEIYTEMGYDVMGTALSWNAAKVLGDSAKLDDEKCVAIEGLTGSWLEARSRGVEPFQGPTLIIVDEAGMVGTRHMSIILEETSRSRYPVKVVLTGDSLQVIPVDAGNALEAIIDHQGGSTRIDTIRRQFQPSHRRAVKRFSLKQSGFAINTFLQQEAIHWCKDKDMLFNMVVRNYVSYRLANPEKKAAILALSNNDVLELNHRVRAIYKKIGLIGQEDITLKATDGRKVFECDFSVGDEVVLRANDKNLIVYEIDHKKSPIKPHTWKAKKLGVFNRNSGKIVAIQKSKDPIGSFDFTIDIGGDTPGRVIVNSAKFKHSDKPGFPMVHNYAGTIYGSQGQTLPKTFMIDSPRMDFRLAYVGMSRHKEDVEVFLDETELHRRLDGILGKRQSLESRLKMDKQKKKIDDAKVELGRYNRSEMLRAVALSWGRHSENLTATMYEKTRRIGWKALKVNAEKNAKIQSASPGELVIDFIPETNVSYPLIDVEKILKLPDPVQESALIRPSDVEDNKQNYGALDMPVDADETHMPLPARSVLKRRSHEALLPTSNEEENTFFGKAFSWLLSKENQEKNAQQKKQKSKAPPPVLRSDVKSAFEDVEGVDDKLEEEDESVLEKLNKWINPSPSINIPYLPNKLCGKVIYPPSDPELERQYREEGVIDPRPNYISFDGVPQVLNVEGGPNDDWIASKRGQVWEVGKWGEPRILSKDAKGNVVARYRLDGQCVVGEGFPPVWINAHGSATSPVYIVAGAKEWFWLRESLEEKYKDDPSKIPHIVWAAKDADLKVLVSSMRKSSKLIIVRSKSDDRQIPWAKDMANMLQNKYRLNPVISPKLPEDDILIEEDVKILINENSNNNDNNKSENINRIKNNAKLKMG